MNTATAAALTINAAYADTMADYAAEISGLAPSYADALRSVRAWPVDARAVACSTSHPDGPADLHAGIAGDALDAVTNWLDGSPYPVPETAVITATSARTCVLRW